MKEGDDPNSDVIPMKMGIHTLDARFRWYDMVYDYFLVPMPY